MKAMAIYFMHGKTFLKNYIHEDLDIVAKTQYIMVSSTLRKTGKYEKQVINANNAFYPSIRLILDYSDYKHNDEYISL